MGFQISTDACHPLFCRQSCHRCVQALRATQVHAREFVEEFPYMVSHHCNRLSSSGLHPGCGTWWLLACYHSISALALQRYGAT